MIRIYWELIHVCIYKIIAIPLGGPWALFNKEPFQNWEEKQSKKMLSFFILRLF